MGDLLTDPEHTRREYANEARLLARASIYGGPQGADTNGVLAGLVAKYRPRSVLEVGCGPGILAERLQGEHGLAVTAIDSSERMVHLAQGRGVQARLGDIQRLRFENGSFDLVIAAWMLYHVPDLNHGLSEVSRVLQPGGRLLAVTNGEHHLEELWRLIGLDGYRLPFNAENGTEILGQHFDHVERQDVRGTVTFPDREAVRRYVASTIKARQLAQNVPPLDHPLVVSQHNAIFTATRS